MSLEPSVVVTVAQLVERLVRLARVRIGLGPFGKIDVKFTTPFSQDSIDVSLAKIETARQALTEALTAMDELKITAEENKRDLKALTNSIARAESDKADLRAQLDALKKIAAIDTEAMQEVLGIPTEVDKWRERIWGFMVGGVVAGLVSTAAWELIIRRYIL